MSGLIQLQRPWSAHSAAKAAPAVVVGLGRISGARSHCLAKVRVRDGQLLRAVRTAGTRKPNDEQRAR